VVKRFLTGRFEHGTGKFIATGARGTQNVYRDNVVMFVFSAPVNFNTVDTRTIKVGIPSVNGTVIQAEGTFYQYKTYEEDLFSDESVWPVKKVYRNRIVFDPTGRDSSKDISPENPYGFEVDSPYEVTVPGLDSGTDKVVYAARGSGCLRTFRTTFRTTDEFLQDYSQPYIVSVYANDNADEPLDGRSNVDSRADIIVNFSEPMLPSAFDVNSTFLVFNAGQNRYTSGTIRSSPDGKTFTFRPAFGYGRNITTITVSLSNTLVDRSGNALLKSVEVSFTTEFDPFAPNYNEVNEDFDNTTFADFGYGNTFDFAAWNGWVGTDPSQHNTNKDRGILAGTFGSKIQEITFGNVQNGYASPWWQQPCHTQNLYSPSQMGGTARTISGYAWRYYYNNGRPVATTHTVGIQLGHNAASNGNLNPNFTGSFSDTPVTVFQGSYSPLTSEINWVTGAKFTKNWAYNGKDHVVIDHNQTSGGGINYWRYVTNSGQGGITMFDTLNGATVYYWNHDIQFFYLVDRSEAQSLWYDTTVNNPQWLDPIVQQTVPPGTSASIVYQGAHESGITPGAVDPTTVSAWTSDPFTDLPGFRFIRFHVDYTSNLGASTRPTIEQVKLPYIFY
jgi:hypothetical protein